MPVPFVVRRTTPPPAPLPIAPETKVFPAPENRSVLFPAPVEPVIEPSMPRLAEVLLFVMENVWAVPSVPRRSAALRSWLLATLD